MSVTYLFPAIRRSNMRGTLFIMVFLFVPSTIFAAIDNNTTNAPADVVVGQQDFSSNVANSGGIGPNTLQRPIVTIVNNKMFIVDRTNSRILIYNSIPTQNNTSADVVIGQQDFTSNLQNQGGGVGANTLNIPMGIWTDGTRLIVVDEFNSRILIYNSIPTQNNASADVVIGQQDFTSNSQNQGGGAGEHTLSYPTDIFCDGRRLFVADEYNHRVLIYNTIPTANNASADVVIGQQNFTSNAINQTGNTAVAGGNTFYYPHGVYSDGEKLFVTDYFNHRVLIYNTIPTANNASADVVIGQQNFTSNAINQTGNTAVAGGNTMYYPRYVSSDGRRLFIADEANRRVLIFNVIPIQNNVSADVVIGQPNFTSNSANQGGSVGANTLAGVSEAFSDGRRLFITDGVNNRVLIYNFLNAPTNFTSPSQTGNSITLSVDSFATALGTAKYYFSRSDGLNSGWITNPTWTDTGLSGDTGYTYTIKYGTGDGIESETVSLPVRTVAPPHGGGRGSRSPGRGGDAPQIDEARRVVLPQQAENVSPLYDPVNQVPPAPAGIISPLRDRLAARIEKRITQYPRLRTTLLRMLQRLDRRLTSRQR